MRFINTLPVNLTCSILLSSQHLLGASNLVNYSGAQKLLNHPYICMISFLSISPQRIIWYCLPSHREEDPEDLGSQVHALLWQRAWPGPSRNWGHEEAPSSSSSQPPWGLWDQRRSHHDPGIVRNCFFLHQLKHLSNLQHIIHTQ